MGTVFGNYDGERAVSIFGAIGNSQKPYETFDNKWGKRSYHNKASKKPMTESEHQTQITKVETRFGKVEYDVVMTDAEQAPGIYAGHRLTQSSLAQKQLEWAGSMDPDGHQNSKIKNQKKHQKPYDKSEAKRQKQLWMISKNDGNIRASNFSHRLFESYGSEEKHRFDGSQFFQFDILCDATSSSVLAMTGEGEIKVLSEFLCKNTIFGLFLLNFLDFRFSKNEYRPFRKLQRRSRCSRGCFR